jgi:hypothetical protein
MFSVPEVGGMYNETACKSERIARTRLHHKTVLDFSGSLWTMKGLAHVHPTYARRRRRSALVKRSFLVSRWVIKTRWWWAWGPGW